MGAAEGQVDHTSSFWTNDDGWQVAWPGAIAFALLFHGFAFVASQNAPVKVRQEPITMAIAMPPPPPEEPPPPEPPKPPPPKVKPRELPPPPNQKPVEQPPQDVQPVTGVTADSVVADNAGGPQVRVGNTTFGNPNEEPLTPPHEVQRPAAVPFDLQAYKATVFERMNKEKRYPRKAQLLGLEGSCLVKLVINRDGSLAAEPELFAGKGTGHDVLDTECLRMAKAAHFPPIVGDTETPVHVTQRIMFSVLEAGR